MEIIQPTLLLNKGQAILNIRRMGLKAKENNIRFRPHFKTHQSAAIGDWFRAEGVSSITVSSFDMAAYFARHGWEDITVAFPVNIREIRKINRLAQEIRLGLLVESPETVEFLSQHLTHPIGTWIKIDVGYHRTGIEWNDFDAIIHLAQNITKSSKMHLSGLLTHAGHTYHAKSPADIETIYRDSVIMLKEVRLKLQAAGFTNMHISVGDTPGCSIAENFGEVDEIRPGNFVFYDVMQLNLGSCLPQEITVAMICPVVAKHASRNEIVIYGGAVHLSKEYIIDREGKQLFGLVCFYDEQQGWSRPLPGTFVKTLSQEHGIIQAGREIFDRIQTGDLLAILPVHSCLTANLMRKYVTTGGEVIRTMAAEV